MAYMSTYDDEEKKKQEAAAPGAQTTSGVIDSSVKTSAGGNSGAVDTKAPTSSGFVNLQGYLDANKGQGADMASNATKAINSEADTYKTDAAAKVNEAQTAIGAKGSQYETGASGIASGLANKRNGSSFDLVGNDVYGDAAKYLGGAYDGPATNTYTDGLSTKNKDLSGRLGAVDSAESQTGLLRDAYGKNGKYSNGFGALDSFLIGNDQGGRDAISATKAKAADVNSSYDDAASKIVQADTDAKGKLEAGKQKVTTAAQNLQSGILSDAATKQASMNAGINTNNVGTARASLGDGIDSQQKVDLDALSSLLQSGYDPGMYNKTFNAGQRVAANPDYVPIDFYTGPISSPPSVQTKPVAQAVASTPVPVAASPTNFNIPALVTSAPAKANATVNNLKKGKIW